MPLRATRARVAIEVTRPLARSIRWGPLAVAAAAAFPVVHWTTGETGYPLANLDGRVQAARVTAVLLCLGLAFVLDDPAAESTAHLPVPPSFRRAMRILLAAPAAAVPWWLALTFGSRAPIPGLRVPWGALGLEFAAMSAVALAASAFGARLASDRLGGVAAGPTFLGAGGISTIEHRSARTLFCHIVDPERFIGDEDDGDVAIGTGAVLHDLSCR